VAQITTKKNEMKNVHTYEYTAKVLKAPKK